MHPTNEAPTGQPPFTNQGVAQLFELLNEIGIIAQLSNTALENTLPANLSRAQFAVLLHLHRLGGAWSPSRLASAFQVTKGAMTNTVKRLAAQGFVAVEAMPGDGRGKLVTLNPAGTAALQAAQADLNNELTRLSATLSDFDSEALLPFLQHLRAVLDKDRDKPPVNPK